MMKLKQPLLALANGGRTLVAEAERIRGVVDDTLGATRHARRVFESVTRADVAAGLAASLWIRRRIVGRYCGRRGDHLAQFLSVVEAVRRRGRCDTLEIGTLFGGSAANFCLALRWSSGEGRIVCIDPLDGMWGAPIDPVSGVAVTPDAVRRNLERVGVAGFDVELRAHESSAPEAAAGLGPESFDVLLIDGLHTYDGVLHDFARFSPFVRRDGVILFDDYENPTWPEVCAAVDDGIGEATGGESTLGTTRVARRW